MEGNLEFRNLPAIFLDFVDRIVYYKNLVELHGYVPIRSVNGDSEQIETKIEYKINTEIEWAERIAQYWKKKEGTKITSMDFNEMIGRSQRMKPDNKLNVYTE